MHPPERQELAERVAKELLALKPFVFPAPKPKPRDGSAVVTSCAPQPTAALVGSWCRFPAWGSKRISEPP
jgi:hypothetical protein